MRSSGLPVMMLVAVLAGGWGSPASAGEVRGVVRVDGPPPLEIVTIEPKAGAHSTHGCGTQKISPTLRVAADGGVQDAVVWLDLPSAADSPPPAEPVLLDQQACEFRPHVVIVPPGGRLAIRNSDRVLHNVRIFPEGVPNFLMHQWQRAGARDIPWRFEAPGRYVVRCGIHPWMYAWVVAAPHRAYVVTDSAGQFVLADIPAGRQTLRVWHETLGTQEVVVEIGTQPARVPPVVFPAPKD